MYPKDPFIIGGQESRENRPTRVYLKIAVKTVQTY